VIDGHAEVSWMSGAAVRSRQLSYSRHVPGSRQAKVAAFESSKPLKTRMLSHEVTFAIPVRTSQIPHGPVCSGVAGLLMSRRAEPVGTCVGRYRHRRHGGGPACARPLD